MYNHLLVHCHTYPICTIGVVLGFDSRRVLGILLFSIVLRPALGPTQPLIQWVPGAISPPVKRSGREAAHAPPSSAKVNNTWLYISTHQYFIMAWCLVMYRGKFTFLTFYTARSLSDMIPCKL